ncbi:MAG: hypothetical protein IPH59_04655 [bacterium]|nr:hypothetical protein [bacterium]
MNPLEKLQSKVADLVSKFEQLEAEKTTIEVECQQLRKRIAALEHEIRGLNAENAKLTKSLQSTNEVALKRISRIVDKIDQFQTELKIS